MKGSYRELHSAIIRAGFTCSNLASAIGISPQALSHKMNGYSLFTAKRNCTHRKSFKHSKKRLLHYFH